MPASDGSHLSEIRFRPRRIFTKDDASFNILTDRSSRPKPQEAGQQQQCSVTHLPSICNGEARRRAPLERERERELLPSFPLWGRSATLSSSWPPPPQRAATAATAPKLWKTRARAQEDAREREREERGARWRRRVIVYCGPRSLLRSWAW